MHSLYEHSTTCNTGTGFVIHGKPELSTYLEAASISEQLRLPADGGRILDIPHFLRAFYNEPIVRRVRSVFCDKTFQKIVRCENGIILCDAHSGFRRVNQ